MHKMRTRTPLLDLIHGHAALQFVTSPKGSDLDCSELFVSSTLSALGNGATCKWVGDTMLVARLGTEPSLQVYDKVS